MNEPVPCGIALIECVTFSNDDSTSRELIKKKERKKIKITIFNVFSHHFMENHVHLRKNVMSNVYLNKNAIGSITCECPHMAKKDHLIVVATNTIQYFTTYVNPPQFTR